MLRSFSRIPLRKCLHTSASSRLQARSRYGLALGASAVAASYFTWQLASQHRRIALEDPTTSPKTQTKTETPTTPLPAPETSETPESSQEASDGANKGAYDPVTGEINWDCPCLGGMAYGPCGQEFRDAFSCFIHSEEEPKGINCVDKFKAMQDCFRAHPEVYADEIMDDDDEELPAPSGGEKEGEEVTGVKQPETDKEEILGEGEGALPIPPPTGEHIPAAGSIVP